VPSVSKRLKAAFNRAEKMHELEAEVVHRLPSAGMVRIWRRATGPTHVDEDEENASLSIPVSADAQRSYGSANYRRVIWEGMPSGGWVVDAVGRSCGCPGWRKTGMCLHVIKATKVAQVPCPGMPIPMRRFVSPASGSRVRSTHTIQSARAPVTADPIQTLQAGDVVQGPATYREYLSETYTVSEARVPELSPDELSDTSECTQVMENSEQEQDSSENGDEETELNHEGDDYIPAEEITRETQPIVSTSQDVVEDRPILDVQDLENAENSDYTTHSTAPFPDIRRSGRRRQVTLRAREYADSKRRRC